MSAAIFPYQRYFQMAEKNGYHPKYPSANYPSANYPSANCPLPMPMPRNMTENNKRAIMPRGQEEHNTRDIVTIKQHQQRMNREILDLENGRGGGQA